MTSFPEKSIEQLDIANPLSGAEKVPLTQSGDTRKTTIVDVYNYILSVISTSVIEEGTNLFYTQERVDERVNVHAERTDNPHQVTAAQLGLPDVTNIKHNWEADADPTSTNDADQDFTIGSLWYRFDNNDLWICTTPIVGSAVWQKIPFNKSDISLANVQNIDVTTWAGSTNIIHVASSAVTDHVSDINHNALLNFVANKHIDHTAVSINTPAEGGLTGGANIATTLTLGLDFSGMDLIASVDALADKVALYDASGDVMGYASPAQVAASGSFNTTVITSGTIAVTATDRGTIYELNNNSTLNFASVASLGAGFFIAFKAISSSIINLNAAIGDTIDGLASIKVGAGNACMIFADGSHVLYTVGLRPEIIIVKDIKAQNTAGGTFTSGAWQKRDIAEVQDFANLLSITSNVLQLQPGTYEVDITCPASQVDGHQARLQNTSDATTLIEGTSKFSDAAGSASNGESRIVGNIILTATKNLEIQHRCITTKATSGFGSPTNLTNEVYTQGVIRRIHGLLI